MRKLMRMQVHAWQRGTLTAESEARVAHGPGEASSRAQCGWVHRPYTQVKLVIWEVQILQKQGEHLMAWFLWLWDTGLLLFSHSVATLWTGAGQASLSFTNYWSLLKLISIGLVMPSNHLILCHPLLLLPSNFPSLKIFSNESALRIRWLKYQSFSFNISPSNEYSGLISFRIDWLDLLGAVVQGILKSLLQYHSLKLSILYHLTFFPVQLSNSYMTTGKTIAWTRWTFVGKVMSLFFNRLSMLVIVFFQEASVF